MAGLSIAVPRREQLADLIDVLHRFLQSVVPLGARAVLLAARSAQRRGSSLDRLRTWALDLQERRGHNKAAVALANKLARIVWATWRYERDFSSRT